MNAITKCNVELLGQVQLTDGEIAFIERHVRAMTLAKARRL